MKLYYLGIVVEPTGAANVRGRVAADFGPGYVNARWPDGKIYTHWSRQLTGEPFGETSSIVSRNSLRKARVAAADAELAP